MRPKNPSLYRLTDVTILAEVAIVAEADFKLMPKSLLN